MIAHFQEVTAQTRNDTGPFYSRMVYFSVGAESTVLVKYISQKEVDSDYSWGIKFQINMSKTSLHINTYTDRKKKLKPSEVPRRLRDFRTYNSMIDIMVFASLHPIQM